MSKEEDWGNEIETEEDGYRAEALRRLKVHQLFKHRQGQTQKSLQSQKDTQGTTESTEENKDPI